MEREREMGPVWACHDSVAELETKKNRDERAIAMHSRKHRNPTQKTSTTRVDRHEELARIQFFRHRETKTNKKIRTNEGGGDRNHAVHRIEPALKAVRSITPNPGDHRNKNCRNLWKSKERQTDVHCTQELLHVYIYTESNKIKQTKESSKQRQKRRILSSVNLPSSSSSCLSIASAPDDAAHT